VVPVVRRRLPAARPLLAHGQPPAEPEALLLQLPQRGVAGPAARLALDLVRVEILGELGRDTVDTLALAFALAFAFALAIASKGRARQGKTRQGRVGQGRARQGRARQVMTRQGRASKTRQGRAGQGRAGQGRQGRS
jgi:hypothetical protein